MLESLDFEARFKKALTLVDHEEKAPKHLPASDEEGDVGFETDESDVSTPTKQAQAVQPTVINFFQRPDAHPVVLDLALLKKYGPEWLTWEPETLMWRIPQDFKTAAVSDLNLHKVQAMKALHFNDTYWQRWEVFNWCTASLNGHYPNFDVMQVHTAAQLLISVDIANRVREDVPLTNEVKAFIAQSAKFDGVFFLPEPLDDIQIIPENDLVNVTLIKENWPSVRAADRAPTNDTILAEQLRRILAAYDLVRAERARLQQQLPLVMNV
jgi:hypothetical protein